MGEPKIDVTDPGDGQGDVVVALTIPDGYLVKMRQVIDPKTGEVSSEREVVTGNARQEKIAVNAAAFIATWRKNIGRDLVTDKATEKAKIDLEYDRRAKFVATIK